MNEKRAVIVGGGISGLSIAYFLLQKSLREHFPLKVTILESSGRFGGVLRTLTYKETRMEAGADAFYAGRNAAADLCRELGLQNELVEAAPCFRHFFILKNGKILSVPELPTSFSGAAHFLKSSHLSFSAKCRMLVEPFVPSRKVNGDESFSDFIRRRFGNAFFQEVAKPLAQGVYMADPRRLSMEAMFPRLWESEKIHGSIASSLGDKKSAKGKEPAEFLTLKGGLEAWVEALVLHLKPCELRLSAPVSACAYDSGWKIILENGEVLHADMLYLAMNACVASKLLAHTAPDLSQELSILRHDSITTVNIIYRCEDVLTHGLDPGFLVPAAGEPCPFSSLKWLGKTEDGKSLLLRAFISRTMLPETFENDDETIKKKILNFLREFFGIRRAPQFINVEHYPQAFPQYEIGHLTLVARIEEKVRQYPGLSLAGNGFRGFGITDCIHRAKNIIDHMELPDWQPCRE